MENDKLVSMMGRKKQLEGTRLLSVVIVKGLAEKKRMCESLTIEYVE